MNLATRIAAVCLVLWTAVAQAQDDELERRFKSFDRNGDGVLTPNEFPNAQLFKRFDRNGDGKVTREEAIQATAQKPAPAPIPAKPQTSPAPSSPAASNAPPTAELQKVQDIKPLAAPLRDLDPVVLQGAALPQLLGTAADKIVAFRYDDAWRQIPVQIDQRYQVDLGNILGPSAQKTFKTLTYADPKLRSGADPDAMFDADDELVFMFKDAGRPAPAAAPADLPGVLPASRVELRVTDELSKQISYVYLFQSAGSLKSGADKDYVNYAFKLLRGNPFGNGPNPEETVIETSRYKNVFSDRWVHEGLHVLTGGASGIDILDRDEFLFRPGVCARSTKTFSEGAGGFIANIDGPVRAIRTVFGCNSGTFAQRDHVFYEGRVTMRTYFRVHPIGSSWLFCDYSPEASGMKYYDNLNLDGVTIDGRPDEVRSGPIDWQFVTGKQGSLTMAWTIITDIVGLQRTSYLFDDNQGGWSRCTGDEFAYGASGPATGALPNTDPILPQRNSPVNRLEIERTTYYDAPQWSLEQAQGRVTAAWFPPRVENLSAKNAGD